MHNKKVLFPAMLLTVWTIVSAIFVSPAKAEVTSIDVYDNTTKQWTTFPLNAATTFPAGMSWNAAQGVVLRDYHGGPIRETAPATSERLIMYVIGTNTIDAESAGTYGIKANIVVIKGDTTARLTIHTVGSEEAIYRQPNIYDITLVADNAVDHSNARLFGAAKVVVNTTTARSVFYDLSLYDASTADITVNADTTENFYGIRRLQLYGTGKLSVTLNNAGTGKVQAIDTKPFLSPGYRAISGDWNTSSVVYEKNGSTSTYVVNIDPAIVNGIVTANNAIAKVGETVTLTVTPNTGYQLKPGSLKVHKGTEPVAVDANRFVMPDGNVTVSAAFEKAPENPPAPPTPPTLSTTPIHRFYSQKYRTHFYTMSEDEKNHIITTYPAHEWNYEGIAYKSFNRKTDATQPIHRFWSQTHKKHFYTMSEDEKNMIINGAYPESRWTYEGIAWYAAPTHTSTTTPIFRFHSQQYNAHFFTMSEDEKNHIITTYPKREWNYEGVAWFGERD